MSDLRAELVAIREERGKLTPVIVLEEARDPEHPLHSRFEWDDSVAAEKYRLTQARVLISLVRSAFISSSGEERTVREFHAVRAADADEYAYEPIEEVLADPFKRKLVMQEMQRQVAELVARYESFNEFWEVLRKTVRRRSAAAKPATRSTRKKAG